MLFFGFDCERPVRNKLNLPAQATVLRQRRFLTARQHRVADISERLPRTCGWEKLGAGLLFVIGLCCCSVQAQTSVTLGWNAVTNAGITGYRLYQGNTSGVYAATNNLGNVTQTTVSGLTAGRTYYFALSAYTSTGIEGVRSGEVIATLGSTNGSGGTNIPPSGLSFAADSGNITAPFIASNGIVYQTVLTTAVTNGGRALYSFNAPSNGNYVVSALVNAPNGAANSFFANIDAEPTAPTMEWDLPVFAGFTNQPVTWAGNSTSNQPQFSPKIFALNAGTHQLIIRGREPNAQFSTITISGAPGASNPAPAIVLSSPADGSSYTAPASINLAAAVTANGHSVTKVQYYGNGTLVGEATSSPYSLVWTNVSAGTYSVVGRLVYDAGSTLDSTVAAVTVSAPRPPPSMTFAADSGTITSPFIASNGIVYQTVLTTAVTNGGRALYNFTAPSNGDYVISAQVNAPNGAANSFFVNVDAEPTAPAMEWDVAVFAGFTNRLVSWNGNSTSNTPQFSPKVFTLNAGAHQLIIRGREANAQLGAITIAAAPLPAPWQTVDVGTVVAGNATAVNGLYTVTGAGNLSGAADNFRLVYQPLTGDGDIRAQIGSVQNTSSNGCAGVIMRESTVPGSKYFFMGIAPDGTYRASWRTNTSISIGSVTAGAGTLPTWVRLARSANQFTAYQSPDGVNWTQVTTQNFPMASSSYLGLAVASGTTNVLNTSTFTNVTAVP